MTYQNNYTLPTELLEQIAAEGLEALPELRRIVINTAMKAERQQYLGLGPYERSPERQDYANGYKAKTVTTRVGEITFAVPQVRQGQFYPWRSVTTGKPAYSISICPVLNFFLEGTPPNLQNKSCTILNHSETKMS
jgi:hypothetical protein